MNIAEKILRAKEDFDEVFEAGKKAEYDAFWNSSKDETDWVRRFTGRCWNDTTFKPGYNLKLQYNCLGCFHNFGVSDFKKCTDESGVVFSTTGMTNAQSLFEYAISLTNMLPIDLSKCSGEWASQYAFKNCHKLVTIDKLIISETVWLKNVFDNCHNLKNVIFEGTLAQNGLNLQWSTKLSKASITSIINCLSSTTSGLSITLSETAVNNAFTTEEWNALIATKSNWTITLV